MNKIFIIFGLTLLAFTLSAFPDGYDDGDENCEKIESESDCQKATASNTSLNCCWEEMSYKENDKDKDIKGCVAIKKDKDIIKKVKEEYKRIADENNRTNFKFKGIDCSSKIMEISYGLFLLFVLFC